MDLMRLDGNFMGYYLIEGYSSLIWTERHNESGEFQLKTTQDIASIRQKIPEGSLVSILQSPEVMLVETHAIATNDDGVAELTIKGVSFDEFLKRRILQGEEYGEPWAMQQNYTIQDAASVLVYQALANNSLIDLTRGPAPGTSASVPPSDVRQYVPNLAVTQSIVTTEPRYIFPDPINQPGGINIITTPQEWWVKAGEVYSQLKDLLVVGDLGIRCARPYSMLGASLVTVNSGGSVNVSPGEDIAWGNFQINIYNGRNRTKIPSSGLTPVVFRYDAGHLGPTSYLFSAQDQREVAWVDSPTEDPRFIYNVPPGMSSITGLNYRAMYVDAGQLTDTAEDSNAAMAQVGMAALKRSKRISLMEAPVQVAPYSFGYRNDYYLGDSVTIVGRYGITQDMQVVEYVRTEDQEGDRAYPTLITKE